MATHSDPTANAAIGAVGRDWKQLLRKAIAVRRANRALTPEERRLFTGIYSMLLTEPMDELEKMEKKA